MSRQNRLENSVGVASVCALTLFGVGLALNLPWLCMLAVLAEWLLVVGLYSTLNRLNKLNDLDD